MIWFTSESVIIGSIKMVTGQNKDLHCLITKHMVVYYFQIPAVGISNHRIMRAQVYSYKTLIILHKNMT